MTDTVKRYVVEIVYDPDKADVSLASFRARTLRQLRDLSNASKDIDLLGNLEGDAKKSQAAVNSLRTQIEAIKSVLDGLGKKDAGFKELTAQLKLATREFNAAEKEVLKTTERISALRESLKLAGVDTKNLTSAQDQLKAALADVAKQANTQAARQVLGVSGVEEQRKQILALNEAYRTLKTSGTASVQELAQAQANLARKTAEITQGTSLLGGSMRDLQLATVATIASTAAFAGALRSVIVASAQYQQGVAAIASITTLNTQQLETLGRGVQDISKTIGIDAVTSFKALYTIIGSGIPPDNALKVLETSAKNAVAGLTTIENSARIGVQVLNAYGLQVNDLDRVYDLLFATVRDGVISFEELADKFGLVLPAARTAGVTLEELGASVVVLTRNGLNAPRTMVALEGAIKQLAAPTAEAADEMRRLGIEYKGFLPTIEQLAKLNLSADSLRRLIPDVEGQRAIATLRREVPLLKRSVDELTNSAGAAEKAFNDLKDTPEQQYKKFLATLEALREKLGKVVLEGAVPLLNAFRELLDFISKAPDGLVAFGAGVTAIAGTFAVAGVAAAALRPLLPALAAGLSSVGVSAGVAGVGVSALGGAITRLVPALLLTAPAAYAFGDALRDNFTIVRALGDSLGNFLGYNIGQVSAAFRLLTANLTGNTEEANRALASFRANAQVYAETPGLVNGAAFAIANLEVRQAALRKEFEATQAAASKAASEFATVFGPASAAVDQQLSILTSRMNQTEASLTNLSQRLAGFRDISNTLFTSRVADLEKSLAAEEAAITASLARKEVSEADSDKKIGEARKLSYEKRLQAINTFAAQQVQAFNAEANAQREVARKTGADLVTVDAQIATKRIELLTSIQTKYNELGTAAANSSNAAKAIANSFKEYANSVFSDVQAIRNKALSESQQYYAKNNEFERLLGEAKKAQAEAERTGQKETFELADKLARKALEFRKGYTEQVIEDGKVVVSQQRASFNAEQDIKRALDVSKQANDGLAQAATNRAIAQKKTSDEALVQAKQFGEAAKEVREQVEKPLSLKLQTAVEDVDRYVESLTADLASRKIAAEVKLRIDVALQEAAALKDAIEKDKPQLEIQGNFETLKTATDAAIAALPSVNLGVDDSKVKASLSQIEGAVNSLSQKRIEIKSNADEISKKLNDIAKTQYQTTLTVKVNYVDTKGNPTTPPSGGTVVGANRGGYISGALADSVIRANTSGGSRSSARSSSSGGIQHFATGGFVGRVPGVGNRDSVFRLLNAGSFVLNKEASGALTRFVGASDGGRGDNDSVVDRVQKLPVFDRGNAIGLMLAKGVAIALENVRKFKENAPVGFVEQMAEANTRSFAEQKNARLLSVYNEQRAKKSESGANKATEDAVAQFQTLAGPLSQDVFSGALTDRAKGDLLAEALGKTTDPKKREEIISQLKELDRPIPFSSGGQSPRDRAVPAMLTPGELVFSPDQVKRIGLQTLYALNGDAGRAQIRDVMRFALGGYVAQQPNMDARIGEAVRASNARVADVGDLSQLGGNTTNTSTYNININTGDNTDARKLARQLQEELAAIDRRRR